MPRSFLLAFLFLLCGSVLLAEDGLDIPSQPADILSRYCIDCHHKDVQEGDVSLQIKKIEWSQPSNRELWERVLMVCDQGLMPPADMPQPTSEERATLRKWLDATLLEQTPIGGTLPRRLSKAEYESTIRKLCLMPEFKLPPGFPNDNEFHGFKNVGQGLILSPQLMQSYTQVTELVADEIFPPEKADVPIRTWQTGPDDLVISFSAASVKDGALRLASRSRSIMRSCTWPSRIEISNSGVYRISVNASTFRPQADADSEKPAPMTLEVRARDVTANNRSSIETFRLLKTLVITQESPETFIFEADLYEGETLLFQWADAPIDHRGEKLAALFRSRFEEEPRFLAAWQQTVLGPTGTRARNVNPLRGRNGYEVMRRHYADESLDLSQATMDSPRTKKLLEVISSDGNARCLGDCLAHDYFAHGPAMELHEVKVEGPHSLIEDPIEQRRRERRIELMGMRKEGQSMKAAGEEMLQRFLPNAFRKPVDQKTVDAYLALANQHWEQGYSFHDGMHLAVRTALISPAFLYRSLGAGEFDDYDLASRLSYFLTQEPPDEELMRLAAEDQLSEPEVLRKETLRLIPNTSVAPFVQSFTRQWLKTKLLDEIMPDPAFHFSPEEVELARREVEVHFSFILRENRRMTDFIDPDFIYTTPNFAINNYGMQDEKLVRLVKQDAKFGDQPRRISIQRGGRFGGLLGQSGIMMATANGVDTQPVLRGVWVLENILGITPPEPPQNVPALTPDTNGATTPRELLAAHTQEQSCAVCHRQIDPLGFMLENFDPVGRWREKWPGTEAEIDPSGVLPDGTQMQDVQDFKKWLLENIDQFSQCLSEKLMTYATGRVPNYAERAEIARIVKENHQQGNRFRDLLLALINSETFRTK
ncbi:DUF1588 domain-containing protein [Calycomorphotria hydatis]|uniref:Planctomycete cytochrome C n=1 Tax=Calycomorphotria hydatis TaxID=2528027 RepID=A0A517T5G6_9PLAN|nr:DUF1588 domain-containing protein [Calycomorphotria hydatis]QDT63619.1 hypothetical protein V22_08430 [Calycomorphotria hydatis]